jgi:hypothetical protein
LRIGDSGLRSSCASVARNSFLLMSAARSSASISRRRVMSLVTRATRYTSSPLRTGNRRSRTQRSEPSGSSMRNSAS